MRIHQLKRNTSNAQKSRVGRGGRRGKTSGRGHKGQKARAGRKLRPEIRDMIKKIPKRRGYGKNRAKSYNAGNVKPLVLSISAINSVFTDGDVVSRASLLDKGLVKKSGGKTPLVKILGNGELKKKISLEGLMVSKSAKEKIEEVGGFVK
jgi:large subunit ribosomal protein L15